MSKLATFAESDFTEIQNECYTKLLHCRTRLEKLSRDPQKDGADREALAKLFKKIDRVLEVLA